MTAGRISPARLRTLFALFAVLIVVLSVRVTYWQTVGRGELLAQATGQVRSDQVVEAKRGTIRDGTGAILAASLRDASGTSPRSHDHSG